LIAEEQRDVSIKHDNLVAKQHHDGNPDEYAEGESDDEEFTAMQTTTEQKSSVNTKVAALESKPDSGE
jgi:hypothetical protein